MVPEAWTSPLIKKYKKPFCIGKVEEPEKDVN
jgi:hypothetical protein